MSNGLQRILYADDEPETSRLMQVALEKSGFAVSLAVPGDDVMRQFRAERHDMVMIGLATPGVDVFQVCAAVRAEAGNELPIVMITGSNDEDSIARAYAANATDFIAKPINWSQIGHRVKYLLRMCMERLELARANARHRATLRESAALQQTLLAKILAGVIVVDPKTRIIESVNNAAAAMFGAPPDEIVGNRCHAFLCPAAEGNCPILDMGKQVDNMEKDLLCADGSRRTVLKSVSSVQIEGREKLLECFVDITERKEAEKYEQFRNNALERLVGGESLSAQLEAFVRGVEELRPGTICSVLLVDEEGKYFRTGAAPSLPNFYNTAVNGLRIGPGAGSCGKAAFTGERVISADIASDPDWAHYKEFAARANLGACWSQPIRSSSGQVLGTFAIYHREPSTPDAKEISVIEQCARLASIAIDRSVAAENLRESETRFRSVMENIPSIAVQGYVIDGTVTFWNQASEQLYGYSASEALGANLLDLIIPPEMKQSVARAMLQMIETHEPIPSGELLLKHKDGSGVPVFSSHALFHPVGRLPELFCLDMDLRERKQAEEEIHLSASVFTHAREGIMITAADGTIVNVNEAFSRITGYTRDEVLGKNPRLLGSGRHDKTFYAVMWRDLLRNGHWQGEIWNRNKDGDHYAVTQTISAVLDAQGGVKHYVALFSDITAIKAQQKQLEHIAHYDALTALPNRALLADRLHQAMAQEPRRGQRLAVAYLDLDGFKAVNDRYGHETGDQLLIALASRMKQTLREGDTLARLGGDEFVAVLIDLEDVGACVPMISRLLAAAAEPLRIGDFDLQVSASLGVTFYPQADEVDADQLLRQADQSMYQAKLAGKNRYYVFDAEQDRTVRGYHESVEHVRYALANHEFVLHYQPKVNMRTGVVVGAEVLIRWQHPQSGLLAPAVFLPVIEDHPLAIDVGEWVIDTALTQMERWQAEGLDIPVSINVGARQLQHGDFVERLRNTLSRHPGIRPGDLELEVLETSALEDLACVSRIIEQCQEIGVSFALDDFGTGYSSLTYLKRLLVNQLKIDQSFVRGMLDDPSDLSILNGVLGLAAAFGRQVIAEGVETVEHGEMLLQLGCELAQGYGIARPMPAADLHAWAKSWHPDPAWRTVGPVSRDDLPLLVACVEHRAWGVALETFLLSGRGSPPALDTRQCRFGVWLGADGRARYGTQHGYQVVDRLHEQIHVLAVELLELKSAGHTPEVPARLRELRGLRDALLAQLKALYR